MMIIPKGCEEKRENESHYVKINYLEVDESENVKFPLNAQQTT